MENIRNTEWFFKYRSCIEQGNLQNAKEVLLSNIPDDAVIYKYQKGTNRNWNCIAGQIPKLWLSQAGEFNDPFDCAFLYNHHSKEIYDRDTEYNLAVKEGLKQYDRDKESEKLQQKVFVACFSERNNSMLMWSHYAEQHTGLCVGYRLHELIKKYNIFPVIYNNQMPQISDISNADEGILYKSILTKCEDWSYEKEWRIIDIDKSKEGCNGKLISFEKPVSIYMGVRQGRTEKKNSKQYRDIRVYDNAMSAWEAYSSEEFYVDINTIINYKNQENIDLYDFTLCKDRFKLEPRSYRNIK
ncbi:DUF2971 domain-containing protein [Eubacterium ventriosum]|jgi:hypothetical protein|uniref:DUF2971 domain-containing protein n=1 Tax=Eubacterium ventriosum TaxID=39496 RepID=UPI00351FEB93